MRLRTKVCNVCAVSFSYPIGRGADRRYCSANCRDKAVTDRRDLVEHLGPCKVEGCANPANRVGAQLCEMHYARLRRNGDFSEFQDRIPLEIVQSSGYVLVRAKDHPLSTEHQGGRVYKHRMVYYDAHGSGPFPCHWCGKSIDWDGLHIDHLDEDKSNNELSNLVASCPRCNQARGRHKMVSKKREKSPTRYTYNGETLCQIEWARRLGISPAALTFRLKHWPLEDALSTAKRARRHWGGK